MINTFKKLSSTMLLMVATVMFTFNAQAEEKKDVLAAIVDSGILKIAMSGDQAPYNVRDSRGNLMGYDVDLARAFANAMQVELQIVELPFAKLLPALKNGEADMIISGMAITAPRSQQATFIGPYNISGKSILSTHNVMEKLPKNGFNDASKRIIALKNSTSQMFVKERMSQATLILVANYEEGVDLLLAGKAEAMIADMAICKLTILRNPNKNLVTSKQPLSIEPLGIAIPTNNPALENLVRNYLNTYEQMGMIEALQKKWFENGEWISALPQTN